MMVQYLGASPDDVQQEMNDTIRCHVRFGFLERLYKYHLDAAVDIDGDDA